MHLKTWLYMVGVGLAMFWSQEAETKSLPVVQIGIIRDGPSELVPELRDLIRKETIELTSREFDIRFPDDLQLQGGGQYRGETRGGSLTGSASRRSRDRTGCPRLP